MLLFQQVPDIGLWQTVSEQSAFFLLAAGTIAYMIRQMKESAAKELELTKRIADLERQLDSIKNEKRFEIHEAVDKERRERAAATLAYAEDVRKLWDATDVAGKKQLETTIALKQAIEANGTLIASVVRNMESQRDDKISEIERMLRGRNG